MSQAQEIRIAAIHGLPLPDGVTAGTTLEVTCRLKVHSVEQEWIDVTTEVGKPEQLPGSLTVNCVAIEWSAT